ncbi:MAG: helix-turn-helix domain-containing protein [Thermomicrobiaceae bacterium]
MPENPSPDAMTVAQLAERTGVPSRRIRFYVAQELLPPPVGRGRASYYTRHHLDRLQQILALREVNLGLDEIRERLGDVERVTPSPDAGNPVAHSWQRWEIIPGVEMHARDDLDERKLSTIRVMVGAVRHVLENGELSIEEWSGQEE